MKNLSEIKPPSHILFQCEISKSNFQTLRLTRNVRNFRARREPFFVKIKTGIQLFKSIYEQMCWKDKEKINQISPSQSNYKSTNITTRTRHSDMAYRIVSKIDFKTSF